MRIYLQINTFFGYTFAVQLKYIILTLAGNAENNVDENRYKANESSEWARERERDKDSEKDRPTEEIRRIETEIINLKHEHILSASQIC